jgi:immunity protein Imm1 of predicted polymorphic toxin system
VIVRYKNQQDESDPMNDIAITSKKELSDLLRARRYNAPFLARLSGDNGFELMVGIAGQVGCVQHSRSDGSLPYLMARSTNPPLTSGDVEFLTADTPTPIPASEIISFEELEQVALCFLETGARSSNVYWEDLAIAPR